MAKQPKNPLNQEQKSTLINWAIAVLNSLFDALIKVFSKKQKDSNE